jgi:hypothetical protein
MPTLGLAEKSAIAQQLGKMGITISLGWYHHLTINQLSATIAKLLSDHRQRQQMSEKGRELYEIP